MPTARTRDSSRGIEFDSSFSGFVLKSFRPIVAMVLLGAALGGSSCKRQSAEFQTEKPKPSTEAQPASPEKKDRTTSYSREGYAVWYVVPANSLPKRRAGKGELTAAHTHLPLQTMVRVTHLANGKSVIVRITDRCITKTDASIDLCKEAAEMLGMIGEGRARVRMDLLPDDENVNAASESTATAAP